MHFGLGHSQWRTESGFQCFAVFSIFRGSKAQWLSVMIEGNAGTMGDVLWEVRHFSRVTQLANTKSLTLVLWVRTVVYNPCSTPCYFTAFFSGSHSFWRTSMISCPLGQLCSWNIFWTSSNWFIHSDFLTKWRMNSINARSRLMK